jgi:hypothetical protein
MVANANLGTPPSTRMQCGAAHRVRRVVAIIAFSYLGITSGLTVLCVPVIALTHGRQAVEQFFRAVIEACLRLPIFCVVSLVAINALLTSEIMMEMFRFGTSRTRTWSDKSHVIAVIVVWIALLSGQLWFALLSRQQMLAR